MQRWLNTEKFKRLIKELSGEMGNVTKNDKMSMKKLEFVAIQFIVKFTVIWT